MPLPTTEQISQHVQRRGIKNCHECNESSLWIDGVVGVAAINPENPGSFSFPPKLRHVVQVRCVNCGLVRHFDMPTLLRQMAAAEEPAETTSEE